MKIVINDEYGGFGLTDEAIEYYAKLKGLDLERRDSRWRAKGYDYYYQGEYFSTYNIERNDPFLVQTVEDLGTEKASDYLSRLKVVTIPDDVKWQIEEYDGIEWVAEQHRTWS